MPNQPPPRPDPAASSRVARLGTIGRCLEAALDEMISEESGSAVEETSIGRRTDGSGGGGGEGGGNKRKRVDPPGDETPDDRALFSATDSRGDEGRNCAVEAEEGTNPDSALPPVVDDRLKERLLRAYGDAVAADDNRGRAEPPAAILRGRLLHYNRFGRQWRIAVADAEIRPRTNLSDSRAGTYKYKHEGRNRATTTLWDASARCPEGDVIKLDGEVLILAYDDL